MIAVAALCIGRRVRFPQAFDAVETVEREGREE
jgi:hypothetical protein